MFRPGLNGRCRARLGTGIVAHNNSAELRNVQIRGTSEGTHHWQHHTPLSLERCATDVTIRAKGASIGVGVPGNPRMQQSGAMLASVASLCPVNVKQSTSNHASDSLVRNSEDMEFSGNSGESSESSTMSDGDSVNINDRQHLLRSTSGASQATKIEMGSKGKGSDALALSGSMLEENEGENEVDEDLKTMPESPTRVSDSDIHSIQREPESAATTWTDDKHSSFLDSMEATFVRSLYNQQGLGHLGIHGNSAQIDDSEQDCVESRPVDAYGCCTSHPTELFELMQGGQQQSYYRPHGIEPPPASAVFANPWVRHFKQRIMRSEQGRNPVTKNSVEVVVAPIKEVPSVVDASQMNLTNVERYQNTVEFTAIDNDVEDKEQSGASDFVDCKDTHSGAEVPEIEQGLRLWQSRLHKGGQATTNPSNRKDMPSWVLKRPSNFEVENADVFVTKRIKSTQQELAQKDLEMLEQYVAMQRAENFQAAADNSDEASLGYLRKAVEPSDYQAGPSLVIAHKDTRRIVGKSAMDQVVPLLGRMDSYESKSSSSFPDLNSPFHLSIGTVSTGSESGLLGYEKRNLPSVPDLNTPLGVSVVNTYTTNQPTIDFTKDGEAVAAAWSSKSQAGREEERHDHEFGGASCPPFGQGQGDDKSLLDGCNVGGIAWTAGKHGFGYEDDELSLELQTQDLEAGEAHECEPQLSPMSLSNSKTWTWGLRGLRRRLHDTAGPAQPSRSLRDGIHFNDPVLLRSSG
uniref:Uncharacterized protein n=2 Tax=Physcomitrium patens TaxID=3218 RepID=A0A2K1IUE1_PHYPA|nr:uncharacterized protein LOC112273309 isoform X1 [Physcomitrium patens]PNR32892.1 hypothetical protein PHYPA_024835 [Physcomitrium patens]|eukprot:XP_024357696.1 uncharacterized protein LOC112273309 isoform X1 [Physcomitrella patens]